MDIGASWGPCAEDNKAGSRDGTSYEAASEDMSHHAGAEKAAWAEAAHMACGSDSWWVVRWQVSAWRTQT